MSQKACAIAVVIYGLVFCLIVVLLTLDKPLNHLDSAIFKKSRRRNEYMKAKAKFALMVVFSLLFRLEVQAASKTASNIFETVSRSIVTVKTYSAEGKETGFGSGVVLMAGVIVTNCHVIEDATKIQVVHQKQVFQATSRHTDWDRDVCTLTVEGLNAPGVEQGNTVSLKVGAKVYAIGAPQGMELTFSEGIVSSLRPVAGGVYLQITAPISPGSSGGGLFDGEGRLIGLPSFYLAEGQQLNFAVPVEWIKELPKRAAPPPKRESITSIEWVNKSIELEQKNDWSGLLKHSLRWTKAQPDNAMAWFALGQAYKQSDQPDRAIAAYQQSLRLEKGIAIVWYQLGNAHLLSNQITKAIEAFQQTVQIDPDNVSAWHQLANSYVMSNQTPKAIEAFQQTIRLDSSDAMVWFSFCNAYKQSYQLDKTVECWQQSLRLNPGDPMVWHELGNAYAVASQFEGAIKSFRQAVQIDPENADAWLSMGKAYKDSQRNIDAIAAYWQAIRVNPELDEAWSYLGASYILSNQYDKAVEALQQAVRLNPENARAWYGLGISYRNPSGNRDTGQLMEVYNRLKTLDPALADRFFSKIILR